MELKWLKPGIKLVISKTNNGEVSAENFTGMLYDIEIGLSFLVESDELDTAMAENEVLPNACMQLEFNQGWHIYTFRGILRRPVARNGRFYLWFDQVSDITEAANRSARIDISVNTRVFESLEKYRANAPVAAGLSSNISADGIGLLSNDTIPEKDPAYYYWLEFSLGKEYPFLLRTQIAWRDKSWKIIQFDYSYGFAFNFARDPDARARLITAMLDYRLQTPR